MRISVFAILVVVGFGCAGVAAQQPTPQPTPPPTPRPTPTSRQAEFDRQMSLEQQRRIRELHAGGAERAADMRSRAALLTIDKLYRGSTEAERSTLAPSAELYSKYAEILKQPRTGLLKLISDAGCTSDVNIITVSPACLQYSMPGAGNSYSFRIQDYRIRRLSDIALAKDRLEVSGQMSHGILVELGRIDLRKVSMSSAEAVFLINFRTARDLESAQDIEQRLAKGLESGGSHYQSSLDVKLDSTYLMRSIAYRGTYLRSYEGKVFNEFDFDKRADIIVAFTVIERAQDGSITLLWRELSRKTSPALKLS